MQKLIFVLLFCSISNLLLAQDSKRSLDVGLQFGVLPVGKFNAITDVAIVREGVIVKTNFGGVLQQKQ